MGKQVISNAGEKVKVTLASKSPEIPSGKPGDHLPMLMRVEAPSATKKHIPVDLVALLDVSGTMNNQVAPNTTRLDLVKKAMKFVIKHLHEDDGLAILPFNEKVLTDYSTDLFRISGQQRIAENKVDKLVAKGYTAFSSGLELAVKILDARTDKNRVGVTMLVTDGLESKKAAMYPISPEVLKKYPVHTIGICAHDPNVLLSIAQQSHGTYSFVDDDELGKIADPFAILLGGLRSIVAVNVGAQIYCTYPKSRSVVKWVGFGLERYEREHDHSTTAHCSIGMLYAGEVKNFIMHVQIDPDTSAGSRSWASRFLGYQDTPGASYIGGDGGSAVYLHTGKQAGDAGENSRMVREQIVRANALEFISIRLTEFKNQKDTAAAKGDSEASAAQVRAGSELETKWAEFMETMDDDLKDGLDLMLDDLQKEVQEMVKRLKQGKGMAYMCSWVSSQQMQRATTMGSVDTIGTQFFTPDMETMLHESRKYHISLPKKGGGGGAPSKLEKRMADWESLKSKAQQMLNQPTDTALAQTWKDLEDAINKAKVDDVNEAFNRGER
ncbi:unnamed protein product [Urochloa decumbens]|uniref:VWFA domain-containing protein n=1 Tax=Urochloa decumbens TaxID=240449 RepID=A0ABC9B8Y9_9POAL